MKRNEKTELVELLKEFDLSNDQIAIYVELLIYGANSALILSKKLNISRAKVYRTISSLEDISLVSKSASTFNGYFVALPLENLEKSIFNQELKAEYMKGAFVRVQDLIEETTVTESGIKTINYSGVDGLKRVCWNMLRSDSEIHAIETGKLTLHLGESFYNKLQGGFKERGITSSSLINEKMTKLSKTGCITPHGNTKKIASSSFLIKNDLFIYGDTCVFVEYDGESVQCCEIISEAYAQMQLRLFNSLWSQGK